MCQWVGEGLPAPVFVCGASTSVLDEAWALVAQDALPEWASVLVESQSRGRGQTRRVWYSPVGNIYAALRLPLQDPFVTIAAAPALSTYIIKAFQTLQCPLYLKWPNDLVVFDVHSQAVKVGGILLEERDGVLLAGIGLNIEKSPTEDNLRENHALSAGILPLSQEATQILSSNITLLNNSQFTYKNSKAEGLWIYLVNQLYFWYTEKLPLATACLREATECLLWKGEYVQLDDGYKTFHGILEGLGNAGELCLRVHGQKYYFTSGSLRFSSLE